MKIQLKQLACALGLSALVAGPAAAELVAGWDFSDLSGDSAAVPAALAANYSIQATGSSLSVSGDVVASAMRPGASVRDDAGLQGGIDGYASNQDPSFPQGVVSFTGGEYLGLTARGPATLEFDVSTAAALPGETYVLSIGATSLAQPFEGQSDRTDIDVSFGDTCGSTSSIGTFSVDTVDTEIVAFLGTSASAGGCVVIGLDGTTDQPLIDNVAISTVPEPGMGALLLTGVAGLLGLARRR